MPPNEPESKCAIDEDSFMREIVSLEKVLSQISCIIMPPKEHESKSAMDEDSLSREIASSVKTPGKTKSCSKDQVASTTKKKKSRNNGWGMIHAVPTNDRGKNLRKEREDREREREREREERKDCQEFEEQRLRGKQEREDRERESEREREELEHQRDLKDQQNREQSKEEQHKQELELIISKAQAPSNTIEVQLQISEKSMRMSILANVDTNAKATCIAPGLLKKIQESGNIAIHAAKVPEISVNLWIDAVIVALGSEQLSLGINDISRLEWEMRLGDIYRQSPAGREIRELTKGTSEYQHIFEIENTSGTILGEQSNNVTAETGKTLPSASEVQEIVGKEDITGNKLSRKEFSIREDDASILDDNYGVDINALKFILKPTAVLLEASKSQDHNIFENEDIVGIVSLSESNQVETKISREVKNESIECIRAVGSRLTDEETASCKELEESLIKAGILIEVKEYPYRGHIDPPLQVEGNARENAWESFMEPTESVASTEIIAEEYLDVQNTDVSGIILSSEDAEELAKECQSSDTESNETLPELICDDSSKMPGMKNTEADLLSRDPT